jgi:hypothetical protein
MSDNPYAAPAAVLDDGQLQEAADPLFYVVAQRKAVALVVATMGAYLIYWFYRNWALYKQRTGERLIAVLRGVFSIFFAHSLMKKFDEQMRASGVDYRWSPSGLATLYVLTAITSNVLDRMSWQSVGSPYSDFLSIFIVAFFVALIIPMQRAANMAAGDPEGLSNSAFPLANRVWLVLGALWWSLVGYGLYLLAVGG